MHRATARSTANWRWTWRWTWRSANGWKWCACVEKAFSTARAKREGGSPAPPLAAPALKARWSVPPWPLRLSPPILSRPSPFTRLNKPTILRNGWKRESRSLDRGCAEGCNAAEPGGSTTEVPATGSVCVRARCALEHEPGQGRMARALASATAFEQMAESGKDAGFALRGELGQHGE